MTLIAWYKLDGNADDSSGNIFHGTIYGATSSDGKIGQAMNFDFNSQQYIDLPNQIINELQGKPEASLSMWVKKHALTNSTSNAGIIQLSGYDNSNGCLYFWNNSQMYLDVFRTNRLNCGFWTNWDVNQLEWHHLTITTKPGSNGWKLYINGKEKYSTTGQDSVSVDKRGSVQLGRNSSSRYHNGLIDDVRIYNHVLSLKEVKELSRAKVLHYKFNDFQEPTENLAPNSDYSNRNYGQQYTASSWGGDAGFLHYFSNGGYNDLPYKRLTKTAGGTGGSYLDDNVGINIEDNKSYTISAWIKASRTVSVNQHVLNINRASDNTYRTGLTDTTLTTSWKKYSWTYNSGSGHTGVYRSRHIIYVNDNLPLEIFWCGFQVEEKPYLTPFTFNVREGTVSDASGYDNHAHLTLETTPRWVEDSKIGSGAYEFNGNNKVQIGQLSEFTVTPEHSFTMSVWIKPIAVSGGSWNNRCGIFDRSTTSCGYGIVGIPTSSSGGNGDPPVISLNRIKFGMRSNHDRDYNQSVSHSVEPGSWHHIVGVYDSDNSEISLYVNGKKEGSTSADFTQFEDALVPLGLGGTGGIDGANGWFNGSIDDPRFYATSLSASDVKELYSQRASLDSEGNYFVHEFDERNGNNNLGKDGVYKTELLSEVGPVDGLVAYYPFKGDADDYSGNQNHGTINGPNLVPAFNGNSGYDFNDETEDWIDMGTLTPNLSHENYLTMSGWFKRDSSYSGDGAGFGLTYSWYWEVGISISNNSLQLRFRNSDGTSSQNTGLSIPADEWTFLAMTYNRNNGDWKAWVNDNSNNGTTIIAEGNQETFRIGRLGSSPNAWLKGILTNIRLYNTILSDEEIKILYDVTRPDGPSMKKTKERVYVRGEFDETL